MREFHSFLAAHMRSFVAFRSASGYWNEAYEGYLHQFDGHCERMYPDENALTKEMVRAFCAQRPTEQPNTCRVRSYAIANFVAYLAAHGATDIPAPEIPAMRDSGYIPHAFTDEELDRFFSASNDMPAGNPNSLASRTRRIVAPVFFRLLYSSGMRTCEARLLEVKDVDLAQGVISIRRSKDSRQHFVALHDSMAKLLGEYDRTIRLIYPERAYFFPSPRGPFLSKRWVSKTFGLIWGQASPSHATAYELRHNYAVENINGWVGEGLGFFSRLVYLSKSMGHTALESTKRYFHLVPTMSDILEELTASGFDDIVPEVPHGES
jgi:integrase